MVRGKKSGAVESVESVLVEAQTAAGIIPPTVPPVVGTAAASNDPNKDWSEEALTKCVKDSAKKIKGYLDSGYVTACYWRLHAALLAMETNRMFGDKSLRQWSEDHSINDSMRSRAKKLWKAFPEGSEEAGKMPLPKAIAYANELAGKGKPEVSPSDKLGKKLKGVQERMQAIIELAAALGEEEVAKHSALLDQIAEEIDSIRSRRPMAVV